MDSAIVQKDPLDLSTFQTADKNIEKIVIKQEVVTDKSEICNQQKILPESSGNQPLFKIKEEPEFIIDNVGIEETVECSQNLGTEIVEETAECSRTVKTEDKESQFDINDWQPKLKRIRIESKNQNDPENTLLKQEVADSDSSDSTDEFIKTFFEETKTETETRMHTSEGRNHLKCEICSEIYPGIRELRIHMGTHGIQELYTCKTNNKGYATKCGRLVRSLPANEVKNTVFSTIHQLCCERNQSLSCEICCKKYSSKSLMLDHFSVHDIMYCCKVCSKTRYCKVALYRHLKKHIDEGPYVLTGPIKNEIVYGNVRFITVFLCKMCPKQFLTIPGLGGHMRNDHENNL
uniref:C2H2-type domain-containing protein n=1 Tax=Clastoptera arizonana TaxID=38151 RepID=A0A1B6D2U9_9HEMI